MASFQSLKKELDLGKRRDLYIFTGDEKEVMKKYITKIDDKFQKVSSLEAVLPQLKSTGLFKVKRTFVIENDKDVMKYSIDELKKLASLNRLIFIFDKVDKRQKFFKKVNKHIIDFEKFTSQQLIGYIKKLIPEIDDRLAFVIAKYSNNDVSRIELEVDKLKHLEKEVTLELLNELISPHLEDRIFDMIDAVAKKDAETVFDLYNDLIELKESPIKIVSLLYMKFRQIFLVQSYFNENNATVAGRTGLNFGQVKFARELCGQFTLIQLIEILKEIQKTEVDMKTGKVDIILGMEALLFNILCKK